MARAKVNVKLVALAIEKAGSTDTGTVSLTLEDIMRGEMQKWESYRKKSEACKTAEVFGRFGRLGIYTSRDIERLIREAIA